MKSTTYDEAIVSLYGLLVDISGLPKNLVVNSNSISGPDVEKILTQVHNVSPNVSDAFIIFDFVETDGDAYGASSGNEFVEIIHPYRLHLRIYGDECHNLALRIFSAFKYLNTALYLEDNGMRMLGINPITSVNEFINLTRWERCDIEIDMIFMSSYEFEQNENYDTEASFVAQPIHIKNF